MAVRRPPGQSCHAVKLHWTAGSEQRFAETESCPLCHRPIEKESCDPGLTKYREQSRPSLWQLAKKYSTCNYYFFIVRISSIITGHQVTNTLWPSPKFMKVFIWSPKPCCVTQIFNWIKTILIVKNSPWGCTECPKFSMFVEIPEYSKCSRFVVTLHENVGWMLVASMDASKSEKIRALV